MRATLAATTQHFIGSRRMFRFAIALLVAASSVAAHGADKPIVHTIALVPSAAPGYYSVSVRSSAQFLFPIIGTATWLDGKHMSNAFTETMKPVSAAQAAHLTEQLRDRLQAAGYGARILSELSGPTSDVESIDDDSVVFDDDIALRVKFDEVGFYSGFGSMSYRPKVNVSAYAFTKGAKTFPFEATVYFGVDAKPGKDWAILAPETARFESFEQLTRSVPDVDAIYRQAIEQIAERLVQQLVAALPPARPD